MPDGKKYTHKDYPGLSLTLTEWERRRDICKVGRSTISRNLKAGHTFEDAIKRGAGDPANPGHKCLSVDEVILPDALVAFLATPRTIPEIRQRFPKYSVEQIRDLALKGHLVVIDDDLILRYSVPKRKRTSSSK